MGASNVNLPDNVILGTKNNMTAFLDPGLTMVETANKSVGFAMHDLFEGIISDNVCHAF